VRVVATVNGRPLKSVITREQILVRVDLRGEPKDTYTLRVAITRTRPDGRRVTMVAVTRIDYHTCVPRTRSW
jgi:DNA-binding response OmpR family regulator